MDRTGKFAVAFFMACLIGWSIYNQREMDKVATARRAVAAEQEQKKALEAASHPAVEAPAGTPPATGTSPNPAPAEAAPGVPEETFLLPGPKVRYHFTNRGGGIARAELVTHEAERGRQMTINEFGPLPIGAISELAGEGAQVPFTGALDEAAGTMTFDRTDSRQLQWTKKFTLAQAGSGLDEYALRLVATFANRSPAPITLPGYFIHAGAAAPVHQRDLPSYTGLKAAEGSFVDVSWFSASGFLGLFGHPERPTYTEARADIAWFGVADQYFTSVLTPVVAAKEDPARTKQRGASVWGQRLIISDPVWQESGRTAEGSGGPRYGIQGALGMPGFTLEPGQSVSQEFVLYTGPREYSRLKGLGEGQEQMMDFGKFGIVSKTLLSAMNWLHARLGSYAAAIVVLTLIIKSLLWPMQNKATQSMKRMQLLQPKMAEIKAKYGEDPARMNTETMKLYKDYGVNPLSGCLPMFIQIPIFWGFYSMLGKAVELRNSHFLWIKDLSQPDTLFHFGGFPVNVLPLVMAGTMLWQMIISPKTGDQTQQRMMFFMPVIFVMFCYNYASALALYFTVQNLFSVAQLYATRNQAPPQLQKAAPRAKKK